LIREEVGLLALEDEVRAGGQARVVRLAARRLGG
jgi:hypothetical protein